LCGWSETAAWSFHPPKGGIDGQPPPPSYPLVANENRIQGTVIVELTVDRTGMPVAAVGLKGPDRSRKLESNMPCNGGSSRRSWTASRRRPASG